MEDKTPLFGYAVLRANFNETDETTFLDNFTKFVLEALSENHPEPSTSEQVSRYVRENFGIDLPTLVAKKILLRSKERGLVETPSYDLFLRKKSTMKDKRKVISDYTKFIRQHNQLCVAALEFFRKEYPQQAIGLNKEECATLIASYMKEHALPLLQSDIKGIDQAPLLAEGDNFLVSAFVNHAYNSNEAIFQFLVEAAKGAMLAAVLQMDVSAFDNSLEGHQLYLDAPLVLNHLGLHGDDNLIATEEILKLSKSLGVKICIFEHTLREVESILYAAQSKIRNGFRIFDDFKVASYFVENDISPSDIQLIIEKLEEKITDLGYSIVEKPDNYQEFGLDEHELQKNIQRYVNHVNAIGAFNDTDSISAIHRLRKDNKPHKFEEATHIFITGNHHLVRASNESREDKSIFPLTLLDSTLAAILWVRRPSLAQGLPEKKILASAWAGMQPDPQKWASYLAEIDKLVKAGTFSYEDALLIRVSHSSRFHLMKEAGGDSRKIPEVKPSELLQKTKEELAAPLQEKIVELNQSKEELQKQASSKESSLTENIEALNYKVADLSAQILGYERKLAEKLEREDSQQTNARSKIARTAKKQVKVFFGLVYFTTLIFVCYYLIGSTTDIFSKLPPWTHSISLIGGIIFAFLSVASIAPLKSHGQKLYNWVLDKNIIRLQNKFGFLAIAPVQEQSIAPSLDLSSEH